MENDELIWYGKIGMLDRIESEVKWGSLQHYCPGDVLINLVCLKWFFFKQQTSFQMYTVADARSSSTSILLRLFEFEFLLISFSIYLLFHHLQSNNRNGRQNSKQSSIKYYPDNLQENTKWNGKFSSANYIETHLLRHIHLFVRSLFLKFIM